MERRPNVTPNTDRPLDSFSSPLENLDVNNPEFQSWTSNGVESTGVVPLDFLTSIFSPVETVDVESVAVPPASIFPYQVASSTSSSTMGLASVETPVQETSYLALPKTEPPQCMFLDGAHEQSEPGCGVGEVGSSVYYIENPLCSDLGLTVEAAASLHPDSGPTCPPTPLSKMTGVTTPGPSFGGEYDWKVLVQTKLKTTKAMDYTYSQELNKLFCKIDTSVPIEYVTSQSPPSQSTIRIAVVYSSPQNQLEVVRRCPNHIALEKADLVERDFFFTVDDNKAYYDHEDDFGRQSVILAYTPPSLGANSAIIHVRFKCLSTCTRKPTDLLITLQAPNGRELGRSRFALTVCSCPGRDRKNAELALMETTEKEASKRPKKALTKKPKQSATFSSVTAPDVRLSVPVACSAEASGSAYFSPSSSPAERALADELFQREEDDDQLYYVSVRGRRNYLLLIQMARMLGVYRGLSPEERTAVDQREDDYVGEAEQVMQQFKRRQRISGQQPPAKKPKMDGPSKR